MNRPRKKDKVLYYSQCTHQETSGTIREAHVIEAHVVLAGVFHQLPHAGDPATYQLSYANSAQHGWGLPSFAPWMEAAGGVESPLGCAATRRLERYAFSSPRSHRFTPLEMVRLQHLFWAASPLPTLPKTASSLRVYVPRCCLQLPGCFSKQGKGRAPHSSARQPSLYW